MQLSLDELRLKLDIASFFEAQGVVFQKKTKKGSWYTDCPFCNGKQKLSVVVSGDKRGLWKCFKCGESGNDITFYSKLHGCSNGEAVRAIKEFMGIEDNKVVPIRKRTSKNQPKNQKGVLKNLSQDGQGLSEEREFVGTSKDDASVSTAMEAAQPRDIYTTLVRDTALSDVHRQELRSKRGFTNELIDELQFRSGGGYIQDVIEKLRDSFTDNDLKESGILVDVNGSLVYNEQLLQENILIPYLDVNGEVYHLRPHKLGFEGRQIEIYSLHLVRNNPEKIVLTEGEFKAAALLQWGIPAIAVPGISAFGGKYFDRLVETLKEFGIKKVTVIFDNEIKDNPEYSNFKEKPEKRYDTELWAYLMTYKLYRAGLVARVGTLPDEWRRDGKVDFDNALAQGRTRNEILKVISAGKTHKEYLEGLPEQAKRIVQRKISRHFARVSVRREFNRYVAVRAGRGSKQEKWEETISNFVLNIKSSFFTPDGVIRNVEMVNEYGESSETFALTPAEMAGLNEWKKFCFAKGNFVFEGNTQDLLNVWKLEFSRDIGDLIYMPDRIGYIDDRNLWLFGNLAVKDGTIYRPDNDGIIWIDGRGYKPQSLQIGTRGEAIEDSIPALSEKKIDIADVARKMKQTVGGYEAYAGIGWVIATIFSNDIFAHYKCMPIVFPHGKRESGKSTFMRWLMSFFGVETEGVGIAETTQNYIARSLSYHSSIGAWFDEYRNEYRVIQKDGFFRSAYNRQLSGKGTATAFQARGFSVHAAVGISGEELPKDNGLFTRLIPLQVSSYKRDRTWYEWFNRHSHGFSYLTLYLLTNYKALKPKIMKSIADLKKALLKKDISDRTAENWAICAGSFEAVVLEDDDFIRWVEGACQEVQESGDSEHMLNQFWNDLLVMASKGDINSNHIVSDGEHVHVWLAGAYGLWASFYRQKTGREPFDEMSIRKYLNDEPYFIEQGDNRIAFGLNRDRRLRGVTLNIDSAPETIREIIEIVSMRIQGNQQSFYEK